MSECFTLQYEFNKKVLVLVQNLKTFLIEKQIHTTTSNLSRDLDLRPSEIEILRSNNSFKNQTHNYILTVIYT